jgi:hypothetical protein
MELGMRLHSKCVMLSTTKYCGSPKRPAAIEWRLSLEKFAISTVSSMSGYSERVIQPWHYHSLSSAG